MGDRSGHVWANLVLQVRCLPVLWIIFQDALRMMQRVLKEGSEIICAAQAHALGEVVTKQRVVHCILVCDKQSAVQSRRLRRSTCSKMMPHSNMLCNPCILGGNKGGQSQKWLPHPCLLGGPKKGEIAM